MRNILRTRRRVRVYVTPVWHNVCRGHRTGRPLASKIKPTAKWDFLTSTCPSGTGRATRPLSGFSKKSQGLQKMKASLRGMIARRSQESSQDTHPPLLAVTYIVRITMQSLRDRLILSLIVGLLSFPIVRRISRLIRSSWVKKGTSFSFYY